MKKYVIFLLALTTLFACVAGCASTPIDDTDATSSATTTTGVSNQVVTNNTTMPPTMATGAEKVGYAAVGAVNAAKNEAAVLLGDGSYGTVSYTGTAPKMGAVHKYKMEDDKFIFTYLTGNTHLPTPSDQLTGAGCKIRVTTDGCMWTKDAGVMTHRLGEAPIFIRYSAVEWRLVAAADIKKQDDSKYTVGSFFDVEKADDYADKDGSRFFTVGAVLLGNADANDLYAPDLTHFDNPKANVVLGTVKTVIITEPTKKPTNKTTNKTSNKPTNKPTGTVSTTLPPTITTVGETTGYAAVGYVSTTDKKAAVLLDSGQYGTVTYTGTAPRVGAVHRYTAKGNQYTFTYLTGNPHLSKSTDQLKGKGCPIFGSPDGYLWSAMDGADKLNHYRLYDAPVFIRYSATAWRLASASDIVANNSSKYAIGSFFDVKKESDFVDKDNFRWYSVGAVLIGNADAGGTLYASDLTIFGGLKANVSLGAVDGDSNAAKIVSTKYPTDDVVIADAVATDTKYGADPTGKKDSTYAIQNAINAVYNAGGGTVWLPAGKYRITSSLFIQPFVTLRGDWQDPDKGTDYGTILLMDVPVANGSEKSGSINISGSAGVIGLTVYYPNQSISAVKPYPFTFYVDGFTPSSAGYMLQTIQNVTLINAYKGVGACVMNKALPHEMLTLENVKGTVLSVGAELYNQADVGTMKNVTFSPKYWSGAASWMNPPNQTTLGNYTKKNATGMRLGDLEWTQLMGITMSHFSRGFHIVAGQRVSFSGALYNVNVTDCATAFLVDNMYVNWGTVIAASTLSGDKSLVNNVKNTDIRLAKVTLSGQASGTYKVDNNASNMPTIPHKTAPRPASKLTIVLADKSGNIDASAAIQNAVDARKNDGGGVVYLPAGIYRVEKEITVPAGVELRGSSSVGTRGQYNNSRGTLILLYPKTAANDAQAATSTAMFTLAGNKAGISGIRFFYPDNVTGLAAGKAPKCYGYTIRGCASDVYVINSAVVGGYNGIDFSACDNHYIKKVTTAMTNNAIYVGGNGGVVEGCLQNMNALCRMGIYPPLVTMVPEADVFTKVFDPYTRVNTEYIRVKQGAKQFIFNSFAYGVKTLIVTAGAQTTAVNIGGDNIGKNTPLVRVDAGSAFLVNAMRYNGISNQCATSASLTMNNRISAFELSESLSYVKKAN